MLKLSKKLEKEIIKNRRNLHKVPELGFNLKNTLDIVEKELNKIGIKPSLLGKAGYSFTIGNPGPTILLGADMDALPIKEESGLEFSSINNNSHACGHDAHTAMLLGAAKILKMKEKELKGQVKFMFQPAEELLAGAKDMVDAGILENPKVDMAMALHITVGTDISKSGNLIYNEDYINYSGDAIKITVIGKGAHGSRPDLGIDAIQIASHIAITLNSIIGQKTNPENPTVIVVGKIKGGTSVNTIADKVTMEVSLRTSCKKDRAYLLKKIENLSRQIAHSYGGKIIFEHSYGMPSLYNDPYLLKKVLSISEKIVGEENIIKSSSKSGSEDFSIISNKVPSVMLYLGVGSIKEGYKSTLHQSSLLINEEVLHLGSALYAYNAIKLLESYNL